MTADEVKHEFGGTTLQQAEGFDLDVTQIEIPLVAPQGNRTYNLLHVVRPPTTKEWKDYDAAQSTIKAGGRDVKVKTSTLAARERLWDAIALCVVGYRKDGKPLVCEGKDWKRRVPILHKSQAIRELGNVWAQEEDDEKNSVTESDEH